jgi:peptidoglycan/LPS O-acetylase OafA/YrhL
LAALIVVFGHAPMLGYPAVIQAFARDYGVLIFFVLSGFLMGSLYLPREPRKEVVTEYAIARVARILPLYLFVVPVSFAISRIDPDFVYQISPTQLLRLLTFNGSVSVFWSIGPEVQFYGLFILLWWLASRSRAAFFLVTVLLGAACVWTIRVWPGVFVLSKFHIFACGVLIAAIRPHLNLGRGAVMTAHVVSTALVLAICFSPTFLAAFGNVGDDMTAFYDNVPRALVAGIIVFGLSYDGWLGDALFANAPMRLLGAISFSVYLLHEAIMYFVGKLLPPTMGPLASLLWSSAAVIVVCYGTYRTIEMPARKWIKSINLRKPSVSTPLAAATDLTQGTQSGSIR